MCNKSILEEANLPWLLTAVQLSFTGLVCLTLVIYGVFEPTKLYARQWIVIATLSSLFTANIAISNLSLGLVSIELHQILRSTCPVITILIYLTLGYSYSRDTYASITLLVVGVALTTLGDYNCTIEGFILTLFGVVLAAAKTVASNFVMTGSQNVPSLGLLLLLAPLALAQCAFCGYFYGEMDRIHLVAMEGELSGRFGILMLVNGMMACLLNIVSLETNRKCGAVTMAVAGNVKQLLTIVCGIRIFHSPTSSLSIIGIVIAGAGAAWYSKVDLDKRRGKS